MKFAVAWVTALFAGALGNRGPSIQFRGPTQSKRERSARRREPRPTGVRFMQQYRKRYTHVLSQLSIERHGRRPVDSNQRRAG